MTRWLRTWLEWTLLGIGIGCVGMFGFVSVQADRFERSQAAGFERSTDAAPDRSVPAKPGSLVGLLSVPRIGISTAVVQGDDSKSLMLSAASLCTPSSQVSIPSVNGPSVLSGVLKGPGLARQSMTVARA